MLVGIVKIKIYIPFAQSLKDKRKEVKSICKKVRNKFNVSIAEVEEQDVHQTIIIGFALVSNSKKKIDSSIDKILNFIEINTNGEVMDVSREIL